MKIPILRIRNKNGNFIPISALKGDKGDNGDNGKSAYEQAKEGGYNGTEEEFIALLNGLTNINDHTPTYTVANELAELTSGEKMSVLLGKVAKGISSLIAHLKNFDNPHSVTLEQLEAAPATHQHSTNDITSGILGLTRGGHGADNAETARENLGAAKCSQSIIATLLSSEWNGETSPYVQEIEVVGLTKNQNGIISISHGATAEQRETVRNALLSVTAQANGALTVTADGDKPITDIPVTIILLG